jgi:NAD(P)-dependent dehydrogenase (short-subunit alcohol dehydrogenase family)
VRDSAQNGGEPAGRHVIRILIRENVKQSVDTVKFRRQLNPTFVSTNDTEEMRKTILITGASSGFGRETAQLFHQQGWNVIATMRSPEKENELNKLDNILVTRLDVQDLGSITTAIAQGVERFGQIDVLLNNAGYGLMGVFESASREQIRKQYEVNVFGLMDVTRAVLPQLRKQSSGTNQARSPAFPFTTAAPSSKAAR